MDKDNQSEIISIIDGIIIKKINSDYYSKKYPVWKNYLGSHHYGKESEHIPENEIWISDKVEENKLESVIQHELIERNIMRGLQIYKKMTPKESWEIAHNFVKSIGF